LRAIHNTRNSVRKMRVALRDPRNGGGDIDEQLLTTYYEAVRTYVYELEPYIRHVDDMVSNGLWENESFGIIQFDMPERVRDPGVILNVLLGAKRAIHIGVFLAGDGFDVVVVARLCQHPPVLVGLEATPDRPLGPPLFDAIHENSPDKPPCLSSSLVRLSSTRLVLIVSLSLSCCHPPNPRLDSVK